MHSNRQGGQFQTLHILQAVAALLDVVGLVHDDTLELGLEPASIHDTIRPKQVLHFHTDVQMLSVSWKPLTRFRPKCQTCRRCIPHIVLAFSRVS